MQEVQLRLTNTNSATESEGSVWGIDASLFGIVLFAALVSITVWLVLWQMTTLSAACTGVLGALPVSIAVAYVLFKQSHPPGYDVDMVECWLWGEGLGPAERTADMAMDEGPVNTLHELEHEPTQHSDSEGPSR